MPPTLHPPDDLGTRLEETLRRATSGRLHGLSVQRIDDRLIVCGQAPTYYVKQLAIEAARTLAAESRWTIVLDVLVAR